MASDGALRLLETCLIVLDRSYTDSELRAAIFTRISREQLEKDVATNGALSREDHGNYHEHLCKHYGQVRRFLPGLISEIHFEGHRAGQSVSEALEFLKRHKDSPQSLHSNCLRSGCLLSQHDCAQLIERFVTHCNTVRLPSAIGYVTPADRLAGRHLEIFTERDRKLEHARQNRKTKRQSLTKSIIASSS